MRADVADHAQIATEFGFEAPAPVGVIEQPVLQIAAGDEPHRPEVAGADDRPRMQVLGIEPLVEVDRVDEPAGVREIEQLARLRARHGERLLAHDVLAGGERGPDLLVMQVVGRREVDDVDALVGEHRLKARVGVGQVLGARLRGRALRGRAHDPGDFDAEPPQRLDMHDADEARPRDRCANVPECPQAGAEPRYQRATRALLGA